MSLVNEVLRADAVEVSFPNGAKALRGASVGIERGSFVVLLGSSGAGKSTLLRCFNGLVKPTSGEVVAEAVGSLASPGALREHRRRAAMIFQQHHLIGRLSVLDNALLGGLGRQGSLASLLPWPRADRELALAAIERVGLLGQALQRSDRLSGGQQQRVGVARALVQQPRILLADEPVASLDPATAEKLLVLLRAICKDDGLTAVVSLHQLHLARAFADRIVGLREGAVVFDGAPEELTATVAASLYSHERHPEIPHEAPFVAHRRRYPDPRPGLARLREGP